MAKHITGLKFSGPYPNVTFFSITAYPILGKGKEGKDSGEGGGGRRVRDVDRVVKSLS